MLSRRAARTHLVASRLPKYFLRLHSAGSVSPGSGRPVRRELGYGPAVRLKPFRPNLTVGALSCAIRPELSRHAPTARTRKAAGAHPGGFPHRRPSPAPIEPRLHPVLVPLIFLRPARHYPRLWLRTPLGVGPTGLPPASNTASPARTTRLSDSRRPFISGYGRGLSIAARPATDMPPREPSRTGHHHRLTGGHRASRFSRMELPRMPRVSDRAGSTGHSR